MAFNFTCPHCFKKTLVDESLAGQAGPCVSCGKEIVIPDPFGKQPIPAIVQSAATTAPWRRPGTGALAKVLASAAAVLGFLVFAGITLYLFWPTLDGLRARRNKVACMNNLTQIARALNAYAAEHGTYPPPIVYDAKGKPMHSWRVLILEELGEQEMYARYNFDQPWDSAENITLLGGRCPRVYISPAISNSRTNAETNYFLVTGNGTVFPSAGPLGPQDIADGTGNTLLVVEAENTIVEWTKPVDIDFAKMSSRIGAVGPNSIGGNHAGGATAVFADATPAWLPDDIAPATLDSIISPAGGEPVDPKDFELH